MDHEKMNQRIKNICQLARFGSEIKINTPMLIYRKGNRNFQEQQKALENLKKDPELEIIEEQIIKDIPGQQNGIYWDKIITIRLKE